MTNAHQLADAFRTVSLRLERALEEGRRSAHLDANDLCETLLSIADILDPPLGGGAEPGPSIVDAARALLEARDNEMISRVEWDRLREAVHAAERHP